ncbi:MAG: enolase C-terminal domain-like protein [Desulfobacterales bacterium]|jgi:hypothetical protein
MKIRRILAYQVDLPLHEGSYKWSGGKSVENFDSTVVRIETDTDIKISKFGGLTKAAQARDLCVSLGIAMAIEDSWGGDIVTAAIAHLAHSTPAEMLFSSTDFNSYVTVSIASGAPRRQGGRMAASNYPGLGIQPHMDTLGTPLLDIH